MKYLILFLMLVASTSAADSTGGVAQGNFRGFGSISDDRPTVEQWRSLQRRVRQVEATALTTYDRNGFPVGQQDEGNKGRHRVVGQAKVSTSGPYSIASVTLNDSVAMDRQDISFRDSTSYSVVAYPLNYNTHTYKAINVSGNLFTIISSYASDTATVIWTAEGE